MKFNKNLFKEKWFAYTFAACTAVVLYLALTHLGFFLGILGKLWQVGKPVFTAIVIAYVMDPLVEFFSKNVFHKITTEKLRHMLSVVLSILTVVLFFSVLMVALVPQVIDSIVMFVGNLNGYVLSAQRLMRQLNSLAAQHDINLSQFISSSDEMLQSITRWLPENVNKIVNLSYGLGTSVFGWIISFILAIYLMLDGPRLKSGFVRLMRALLPTGVFHSSVSFWSHCNNILVRYIAYDLLDGLIIGLINWLFMLAMKMPYVAIVSVVVGVTNLAPTFGPMIGAVIGAFILVLVNPWHALWFLLFTMVLQTVDGYILKPRLFGEQLGVSSVWILIALIVGGRMMGVAGILLAIPAAAIADYFYHDFLIRRLEANKEERMRLKAEVETETAAAAPGEAEETGPAKTEAEAVPRPERVGMEAASQIERVGVETVPRAERVGMEAASQIERVGMETVPRTEQIEGEAVPRAERAEADALRQEGGIPPKPAEKAAKTE